MQILEGIANDNISTSQDGASGLQHHINSAANAKNILPSDNLLNGAANWSDHLLGVRDSVAPTYWRCL